MLKYDQPDFYKFNQDSIELVNFTLTSLVDESISNIIDIGCGCGVMGIEYSLVMPVNIDFLEVQDEFIPFIKRNTKKFNIKNFNIINLDLLKYENSKKYDLILVNPPYYTYENSRKSNSEHKNTCRLILKDQIQHFTMRILKLLNKNGSLAICYPKANTDWDAALSNMNLKEFKTQTIGRVKYLILKNI